MHTVGWIKCAKIGIFCHSKYKDEKMAQYKDKKFKYFAPENKKTAKVPHMKVYMYIPSLSMFVASRQYSSRVTWRFLLPTGGTPHM